MMGAMPTRPPRLSVEEIRRRYVTGDEPVTGQLLGRLRRDPRKGVQQLLRSLERQYERRREERLRLDAMLNFERLLWNSGLSRVAGVDEAGMGPLAGPVVAAAVVFPPGTWIPEVDDSKRLDPRTRLRVCREIHGLAADLAVGVVEVAEIDTLNIHRAGLLAMRRAVEGLREAPEHLLVDARTVPGVDMPQNPFRKGDGLNFTIAAASIVAKTRRDAMMEELDRRYPGYGFAKHKGYGTKEHQRAIRELGPCPAHRASFPFIRELRGACSRLFYQLRERLCAAASHEDLSAFEEHLGREAADLAEEEQRRLRSLLVRRWKTV